MTMYPWMEYEPAAEVREDEQAKYQRLVKQGQEAAELEAEGKHANVAWVQALKTAYPDLVGGSRTGWSTHPKVYEIVMAVRGCTRLAAKCFIGRNKSEQARVKGLATCNTARNNALSIRRAVIELTTKYKLGADPKECMDALTSFYEENSRG